MIHKIMNSGSEYTIEGDNYGVLSAAIFLLGKGNLGTDSIDTEFKVPITIVMEKSSGREWFKEKFNVDLDNFIEQNKIDIADSLTTVLYGSCEDRDVFFKNLDKIQKVDKYKTETYINNYFKKDTMNGTSLMYEAFEIASALIEGIED